MQKLLSLLTLTLTLAYSLPSSAELYAAIETSKGTIKLELYADQTPLTVTNFINLAQRGFYDGLNFHRVINNFMIQGGCPEGNGTGGPGYRFEDEFVRNLRHNQAGLLSMANAGPGTNGSQFFITHVPTPHLDGRHTIFGKVVDGLPLVYQIQGGDQIKTITIEGDTTALFAANAERLAQWNRILDQTYPKQ